MGVGEVFIKLAATEGLLDAAGFEGALAVSTGCFLGAGRGVFLSFHSSGGSALRQPQGIRLAIEKHFRFQDGGLLLIVRLGIHQLLRLPAQG